MSASAKAQFRVRFVIDDDAVFEESNGESRPLTEEEYKGAEYQKDGADVPYAEYLEYYGNPDRHVYLGCIVEKACKCCGHFEEVGSLWRIDFMDDAPELRAINPYQKRGQTFSVPDALALPGYLPEVARDVLSEAGYTFPRSAYCAKRTCNYFHITGSKFCAQHQKETK